MADGSPDDDDGRRLAPTTRRTVLKYLGAASVLGGTAYGQTGGAGEGAGHLGGFPMSLTAGRTVDEFWTGPRSAFSPGDLQDNLPVWVDDGEIGVIEDGAVQRLPIGKTGAPIPSLVTDQADVTSTPASYHVYTDESTIWAIPQQNPAGPSMAEVQDTDIGNLLTEIKTNQLPPQGNANRHAGMVILKRGDYPGTLSNEILGSQFTLRGEIVSQDREGTATSSIPTTNPPVRLHVESGQSAFVAPSIGGGHAVWPRVENLQLNGAGTAFDEAAGDAIWDFMQLNNVHMWVDKPFDFSGDASWLWADRCYFKTGNNLVSQVGNDRSVFSRCYFVQDTGSSQHFLRGGYYYGCDFEAWTTAVKLGPANVDDTVIIRNSRLAKIGSTQGGTGFRISASASGNVDINGLHCARESGGTEGWTRTIYFRGGKDHRIRGVYDHTPSNFTFSQNGATDPDMSYQVGNGVRDLGGTRPRWNQVIGGGPLGGVDLGSTTGQYVGDRAVSDGTNAATSAGDLAYWTGSAWAYQNQDGTITPS